MSRFRNEDITLSENEIWINADGHRMSVAEVEASDYEEAVEWLKRHGYELEGHYV